MAEDRPLETLEESVARNERERKDFESTILARMSRRPAGTTEWTLSTTPREFTLFLHGQTLARTTYPDLWRWVQDTSPAGFGTGDGSTTFTVPDTRGRVLRCTPAAGETVGQQVGADTRVLSTANMPAHDHNVGGSTGSDSHSHSGTTGSSGSHGGHSPMGSTEGGPYPAPDAQTYSDGNHSHSFSTGSDSHSHSLSITESSVGSGTGFDNRQASLNGHLLVWF